MVPGPGKYSFKSDRQDFKRVSYSMRGKYTDPLDVNQNVLLMPFSPWDLVNTLRVVALMGGVNT